MSATNPRGLASISATPNLPIWDINNALDMTITIVLEYHDGTVVTKTGSCVGAATLADGIVDAFRDALRTQDGFLADFRFDALRGTVAPFEKDRNAIEAIRAAARRVKDAIAPHVADTDGQEPVAATHPATSHPCVERRPSGWVGIS